MIALSFLYIGRTIVRLEAIIADFIILYFIIKISPMEQIRNVKDSFFATVFMAAVAVLLKSIGHSFLWELLSIIICIISYFCFILLFSTDKKDLIPFFKSVIKR